MWRVPCPRRSSALIITTKLFLVPLLIKLFRRPFQMLRYHNFVKLQPSATTWHVPGVQISTSLRTTASWCWCWCQFLPGNENRSWPLITSPQLRHLQPPSSVQCPSDGESLYIFSIQCNVSDIHSVWQWANIAIRFYTERGSWRLKRVYVMKYIEYQSSRLNFWYLVYNPNIVRLEPQHLYLYLYLLLFIQFLMLKYADTILQ